MHTRCLKFLLFSLLAGCGVAAADTNQFLPAIPAGYFLRDYDDCGVAGRQPHVLMKDCYLWTFATSDTDAGPKERSAVFSYQKIQAVYTNLDPGLSYVLALTYASDHVYHRVQSLEANGVVLHGPYALPQARATRVIVRVPAEVTRSGKMALMWKIHGEVNATVSIIELWADAPGSNTLQLEALAGLPSSLQGQVLDLAYDPVPGAEIRLDTPKGEGVNAAARSPRSPDEGILTGPDGIFSLPRTNIENLSPSGRVVLLARKGGAETQIILNRTNLFFDPVHFRPRPEKTGGLAENCLLLDGAWALSTNSPGGSRVCSLGDPTWKPFRVPGQFLQQGFDIPQSQTISVAREFLIPQTWAGYRLILRFDAVHAGTRYWLNGQELGYSENLFTPVEWDITEHAAVGRTNRLDLGMTVATSSEALSYSSAYAFHNLGGIDRSVRLFALPKTFIRQLRLEAGLDGNYRDGNLRLEAMLEGGGGTEEDLALTVGLLDAKGRAVKDWLSGSPPAAKLPPFSGSKAVGISAGIANPSQWSAEKPNLYRLVLELRQGGSVLERVERNIGFRAVEVRGSQLLVNGQVVKLAGACHHEFDPLTGRADTARHAETDVRLIKAANLNHLRTSHYPPTEELLATADRLGMYVEVEAPFCWVGGALDNSTNLAATLTPTSAMLDLAHAHPSVIFWSLANESHFNLQFLASARLCKELDPTRPLTFNHDFAASPAAQITDIANIHYPSWPFENVLAGDSRPLYFGEYFFPVCHEQTDVSIDPGLRELWGQGQAEPDSDFARACARDAEKPPLKPGVHPGGWSAIYHSPRLLGGSIWASHDEAFFFSATNHVGYAWHHGFWGLIDYWRRPKPEWYLARHIFSPVWLTTRHLDWTPGAANVSVPVENRYAFTDFKELSFDWSLNGHHGRLHPQLRPGARGQLELPVPRGTHPGDQFSLRVSTAGGQVVDEALLELGRAEPAPLSRAPIGPPRWHEEGPRVIIEEDRFALVFDRATGDFLPKDPRHTASVVAFPSPHVTRYDFGDLNGPNSPPYAVFPEDATRHCDSAEVSEEAGGLRLIVHDRYTNFAGTSSWLLDRHGCGTVSCDYGYSGPAMETREAGIRLRLRPDCEELKWRRWSEWGAFPRESISRAEGTARGHRDARWGTPVWNEPPAWPWSLDETELGTADFRSIKFNIYSASLLDSTGSGLLVQAKADAHFRAALATNSVAAHLLWRCPLGQVTIRPGDRIQGSFSVELLGGRPR